MSTSQNREQILSEHITHTYPKTANDYVAKEHFWVLGEEVGLIRKNAGKLFSELCFPVYRIATDEIDENEAIGPEALGLSVKKRSEVGLPFPPIIMSRGYAADNVHAHISDWRAALRATDDYAVQISGVAGLEGKSTNLSQFLTPLAQVALNSLSGRLLQFPAVN